MREYEAADRNTAPKTRSYVPDLTGIAIAVVDQVGNDPARDTDFGALVCEDEEGAENGDFAAKGEFQIVELAFGGGDVRSGD